MLSVRGGINVTKATTLTLAIENLTDKKYRAAHSRWDAVGINFIASIEVTF